MSITPQVLAAISGAIAAYIADEESCQAAAAGMAAPAPAPAPPLNLWALAGRQEAMQLRLLMQRRSLR
ncbi:MAG: hypothetical protein FJ121_05755 [Deltaproteobacteria bacterium]|nr:hypothetical protein [Deltaproteobacteria bacterium]